METRKAYDKINKQTMTTTIILETLKILRQNDKSDWKNDQHDSHEQRHMLIKKKESEMSGTDHPRRISLYLQNIKTKCNLSNFLKSSQNYLITFSILFHTSLSFDKLILHI